MRRVTVISIFLIIFTISFSENKFKDIPKDHWAYESVENLINLGVIEENTFDFKGDNSLTRYEFAYDLSKALTKINLEKADQRELDVLTSIIGDFSEELNKTGFDRISFEKKINDVQINIKNLTKQMEINKVKLDTMEKRLKIIERELNLD